MRDLEAIEGLLRSLSVHEPDIASGSHGTRQHGTFRFVSRFTRKKQSEYPEIALEKIGIERERSGGLQINVGTGKSKLLSSFLGTPIVKWASCDGTRNRLRSTPDRSVPMFRLSTQG